MAITQVSLTRISDTMRSLSLLNSLRQNNVSLFLQQNRVATGRRLNAPSENPALAAQTLSLSELLDRQTQLVANIQHADSILSMTDTAVGEVSNLLIDAHNIGLSMINGTTSSEERQSEAQLILAIIDQLVTVGNRKYGDIYLFGGQQTQDAPFTQQYGVAEYRGDEGALLTRVDYGQDPRINVTGAELYGALEGSLKGWMDLDPALTRDTRLVDVQGAGGQAIRPGFIRVSLSEPNVTFNVDLTHADTAGDVVDLINEAARQAGLDVGPSGQFNVDINAARDGYQLSVGSGVLTVSDLGDSVVARDLGIRAAGQAVIVGEDLRPLLTARTTISSLFGGNGVALGAIHIDNSHLAADIDLSDAVTIQDVLNRINTAGVAVQARINADGSGIDVVNLASGMRMKVSELGDNTANVLGIRSYHAGTMLSGLNQGRGVQANAEGNDLNITAKNGVEFQVSLRGAVTVQDVLDKINAAAAAAGVSVVASLVTTGNGIELTDNTGGAGPLSVSRADLSYAIDGLGLEKATSGNSLTGDDLNGIVPDSVFTALHDLYTGLMQDDEQLIGNASNRIEGFMRHAAQMQGEVGSRSQAMNSRLIFTQTAVTGTQTLLSNVRDLDYTEAITQFQQAQTTLQANLLTGSRLMQLSLLNFLQ